MSIGVPGLPIGLLRGGFNPASLFAAGEQGAWFDPSDFTTMYQDSAGTTPVTATGQPVGKILDKSGRGNHATQGTAGSRPTLQQDGSGFYYLSFDGVDDSLATAAFNLATNKVSVTAGANRSKASQAALFSFGQPTVNTGAFEMASPIDASNHEGMLINNDTTAGTVAFTTLPVVNANTGNVFTGLYDRSQTGQSEIIARFNGVQQTPGSYTGADTGTANFGSLALTLGCRTGGSVFYLGRIYPFILRGVLSTSAELASTERYVGGKMGIAL